MHGHRSRLVAAFLAVYFIWGSTYLAIRFVLATLPPFVTAGGRFIVAGLILYAAARLGGAKRPTAANWRASAIIGVCMLVVGNGAVMWAEGRIPSGPTALTIATEPILIVLLQGVLPTGGLLCGLLLGIAGMAILLGRSALAGVQAVDPLSAAVLVFGSLGWAKGSLLGRKLDIPKDGKLAAGMQMLAGGAGLFLAGVAHGERIHLASVSRASAMAVGYLVLFGSIVGYTAYGYMVKHASPSLVSTYAFVNPVVAVVLGTLVGHEPFTPRIVLAALVIVAGVAIITLTQAPRHGPRAARVADATTGNTG